MAFHKLVNFLFVTLTAATLFSCSAFKVAYHQADFLLKWQVDKYFDLTPAQDKAVTASLKQELGWHRNSELPQYRDLLVEAKMRLGAGAKIEDLRWLNAEITDALARVGSRIEPETTKFLKTLSDSQIDAFQKVTAKENKKRFKNHTASYEKYLEKRTDDLTDKFEMWMGTVSDEQETAIREYVASSYSYYKDTRSWRVESQQSFAQLLKQRHHPHFEKDLRTRLENWQTTWPAEGVERSKKDREQLLHAILKVDSTATDKQRKHVMAQLDEWIAVIDGLTERKN